MLILNFTFGKGKKARKHFGVRVKRDAISDYDRLSIEYQRKADRFAKNLLIIQRAESAARISAKTSSTSKQSDTVNRCSFCGKTEHQIRRMFLSCNDGNKVLICDECVELCHKLLRDLR